MASHSPLRAAPRRRPAVQAGFTLVEALAALVVLAFGLMAIAGFQLSLSRNADVAKQRTEAVRLAQDKMEELRLFEVVGAASLPTLSYANIATSTSSDTPVTATNTAYSRTWTVGAFSASPLLDRLKTVDVQVSWVDRAGETQSVNLASVISQANPADIGGLTVPPIEGGLLRRPKNREIGLPVASVRLAGANRGKSKLAWGGGGWLVFNDASGDVIARCSAEPGDTTNVATECAPLIAYVVSGFIAGDIIAYVPTGIVIAGPQYIVGAPDCFVGDAYDQNTGSTIANLRSWRCLIQPSDHDADPDTPPVWSGRVDIVPDPAGSQLVCRFTPNETTTINNQHPRVYQIVNQNLENQNFTLRSSGTCPTGMVQHQPAAT